MNINIDYINKPNKIDQMNMGYNIMAHRVQQNTKYASMGISYIV